MAFVKTIFLVLISAVMGISMIFIPECCSSISMFYTAFLGAYLGMDIASMIAKTASLPKGEYKELRIYKYIATLICLCILIGIGFVMKFKGNDMTICLSSFVSAIMIEGTCLLGGIEGNKIATNSGEEIPTVI